MGLVGLELHFRKTGEGRKAKHIGGRNRMGKGIEAGMFLLNEMR